MELNLKAQEFITNLKQISGWNRLIIFSHAYHESGRFEHIIGAWNCWGIKKPKNWVGKVIAKPTKEFINNQWINTIANWIDFDNAKLAISWYCDFIARLYPNAFLNRLKYTEYFTGLLTGKYGRYATDPQYAEKLKKLYEYLKKELDIAIL